MVNQWRNKAQTRVIKCFLTNSGVLQILIITKILARMIWNATFGDGCYTLLDGGRNEYIKGSLDSLESWDKKQNPYSI